jgi:hypothetical protein
MTDTRTRTLTVTEHRCACGCAAWVLVRVRRSPHRYASDACRQRAHRARKRKQNASR